MSVIFVYTQASKSKVVIYKQCTTVQKAFSYAKRHLPNGTAIIIDEAFANERPIFKEPIDRYRRKQLSLFPYA